MKILLSGASGLIGKEVIRQSLENRHEVIALVRSPEKFSLLPPKNVFRWEHTSLPPLEAFEGVDSVIHLAGEGIADKRWSARRKKSLRESRVLGTKNLISALAKITERPQTLISGSAIGYYGSNSQEILTEESPFGADFLANLCKDWEIEAAQAEKLGLRVVFSRTAIVLAKEGGALAKMPPLIFGAGRQWMSWIHIEDVVKLLFFALENKSICGPLNVASPAPIRNKDFIRALAKAKGYPFSLHAPSFLLRLALGEMSIVLLGNQKVVPEKALRNGFQFTHTDIDLVLKSIF